MIKDSTLLLQWPHVQSLVGELKLPHVVWCSQKMKKKKGVQFSGFWYVQRVA